LSACSEGTIRGRPQDTSKLGTVELEIEFAKVIGVSKTYAQKRFKDRVFKVSRRTIEEKGDHYCVLGDGGALFSFSRSTTPHLFFQSTKTNKVVKTKESTSSLWMIILSATFSSDMHLKVSAGLCLSSPTINQKISDWLRTKGILASPAPEPEDRVDPEPPMAGPSRPPKRKASQPRPEPSEDTGGDSELDLTIEDADELAIANAEREVAEAKLKALRIKVRTLHVPVTQAYRMMYSS
jgi:hypothetical protein